MEITFNNFIGNPVIVKTIKEKIQNQTLPKQLLFSGISGVGKTTLAHIIAKALDAHTTLFDVANLTGIDNVRQHILEVYRKNTLDGRPQLFILDEIHKFSKPAQESLLTPLDQNTNTYFIACTTEPHLIKSALFKRFTHFKFIQPTLQEKYQCLDQLSYKLLPKIREHIAQISVDLRSVTKLAHICHNKNEEEGRTLCVAYSEKTEAIDIVRQLYKIPIGKFFELLKKYNGNWDTLLMVLINYYTVVLANKNICLNMSYPVQYGCEKARIYELALKIKNTQQ